MQSQIDDKCPRNAQYSKILVVTRYRLFRLCSRNGLRSRKPRKIRDPGDCRCNERRIYITRSTSVEKLARLRLYLLTKRVATPLDSKSRPSRARDVPLTEKFEHDDNFTLMYHTIQRESY